MEAPVVHCAMRRPLLLLPLFVASCTTGGNQSLSAVNDELRTRNQALAKQVSDLERERDELKIKLAEANGAAKAPLPREVTEALPRVTTIELDSLSGLETRGGTKRAVLYVTPTDGRGRFAQLVGTLTADVTYLPSPQAAVSPRTLATVTLSPTQLRDAYRSNFTGTHYTIELDLPHDTPESGDVTLRAHFTDALTGQVHAGQVVTKVR